MQRCPAPALAAVERWRNWTLGSTARCSTAGSEVTLEAPFSSAGDLGRVLTAGAVAAGEGGHGHERPSRVRVVAVFLLLFFSLGAKLVAPLVSTQILKAHLADSSGYPNRLAQEALLGEAAWISTPVPLGPYHSDRGTSTVPGFFFIYFYFFVRRMSSIASVFNCVFAGF